MEIINRKVLERINFTDFEVLNINLDKMSKSIVFTLSGGWHLVAGKRTELGKGHLKIAQYDSIRITSYNAKADMEKVLSEDSFERLREICEIDIHEDKLTIKGFARQTHNWIEFDIVGGKIAGEFVNKN